jgi:peptide/nickel transport system permease protein
LEVMNLDYVRTARSKGIPEYVVVLKHGIRNTLIEISTIIGLNFATMIGGLILTEVVFTRPGLGKLLIGAIMDRDYNLIQSGIMFFAALVIFVNLLVDITYSFIDPRVKYD